MIPFLKQDSTLEKLESLCEWDSTIAYCKRVFNEDGNCNNLVRLMSQAWFLCAYIEQLPPNNGHGENIISADENFIEWTNILSNTLRLGTRKYENELSFLCISDHMMITLPEFFVSRSLDYNSVYMTGQKYLMRAQQIHARVGKIFSNLGNYSDTALLHELFPGNSQVEIYFKG